VRGRQRDILNRFYHLGQQAGDIATATGLAVGHVRVLLHRLRTVLRECVERRSGVGQS